MTANKLTSAGTNKTAGTNDDAPCITFDARARLRGAYDDATVTQIAGVDR